ncbi:MAG: hypothetical protein K0R31_2323 [Clostridiales bacterium]|nr:hypothetical protein [Clostridiales bacterium]
MEDLTEGTKIMYYTDAYNKWYALFVETGEEDRVKERLNYKLKDSDLVVISPKRLLRERRKGIWETITRPLLPGYILINGCIATEEYYAMKGVPGLIKILHDKNGPLAIHENELGIIRRLIKDHEAVGASNIFVQGSRIIVIDGPLYGMEGFIESIDTRKGRAKVRLNFLGELKMVDLSISMVQSA